VTTTLFAWKTEAATRIMALFMAHPTIRRRECQGIVLELSPDDVIALEVPLPALDHFGVEEYVVRHDDRRRGRS